MDIYKLLEKMSLKDKIYQLFQPNTLVFAPDVNADITGPVDKMELDVENIYETGSVLNSVGARRMIEIQKSYLEHSKNKIPLIFMQDVIHGYRTIYPINLGLAASFDADLAKRCAQMAAKEASVDGVQLTFAPMVDLARDARWGRVMESSGEDPYLNCIMAKATVEGYEGNMGKYNVAACVKHYAAYGGAESGKDYNLVDMSEQTLREYYLPSYKAAVDAGVRSLMTSFNSLNGVPSSGNKWLVDGILRKEWGFDGVIISDYTACLEMITHGYAEDEEDVAYKAMEASIDIEMVSTTYPRFLEKLVLEGRITVEQIDRAVLRILKLKEELGLFENPYRSTSVEESERVLLCKEHRDLAREAAEKSAVLLKNNGVLPISKDVKSIAVIGPLGITGEINGNWHCSGKAEETVSVYDGIKALMPNVRLEYAQGCPIDLDSTDESMVPEAAELARNTDAVILCLGEAECDSGESICKTYLDISEAQYKLLNAVVDANPNTAVLLFTGRPLTCVRLNEKAPAILNMWMPGTEGGAAAANLIFGNAIPGGKITMSFPYRVGQCPIYYNHYMTGRPKLEDRGRERFTSSYIDCTNKPLYPFGYGLSYSTFEYSDFKLSSDRLKRGDSISASCKVKNTGKYKAMETVQLYIRDVCGSVVRPVKELKGFEKIELEPNEEREVSFKIDERMLEFYGSDLVKKAESGKFKVFIAPNSDCEPFAEFILE